MAPLRNQRHEKLVRELAKGERQVDAMAYAGYRHRNSATKILARTDVQARLAELMEQYAEKCAVAREELTAKLQLAYLQAMEQNQISAAVQACKELSQLHGLRVEKHEHAPAGTFGVPASLSDAEYAQRILTRIHEAVVFATVKPPSDSEQ